MTVTAQNYALVLGELNLDEQQITAAETLLRENPLLTQVLSDPRVRFAEKRKVPGPYFYAALFLLYEGALQA